MSERWAIIVHGGAKTIRPDREAPSRAGCLAAVEAGQAVLEAGGAAIDGVVAAIKVLEEDRTFNAGYGAVLNASGQSELDAALMDGEHLDLGAVAAVRGVRNPIDLCRAMLMDAPVLLVGEGAVAYAREKGVALCDPAFHAVGDRDDMGCDTVGCVALDVSGHIAAGTSTGGLSGVRPGRVGDSPIPGCGLYAEDAVGGVSFSGDGESILRLALAGRLMAVLPQLGAGQAAEQAIGQMPRVGGEAGCIVIDALGRPDFAHNSQHFAVAVATSDRPAVAFLRREEAPHD
jgi:beta-aspartyl-peptidase (threonine type)